MHLSPQQIEEAIKSHELEMIDVLTKLAVWPSISGRGQSRFLHNAMCAIEFNYVGSDKPDPALTKLVQARALEEGLLLLTCGVYGNVIRFLFPLTIRTR
jgi:hypothetical protein